ncbi:MAG: HD domain-containing protein [Desulfitobacterium sp.]|nr:HD domain-containing protein [Desulfitobacterium sp.]
MLYRVRQVWKALYPKITPEEISWAAQILPCNAFTLFQTQSLTEQRHGLDVALDLATKGIEDQNLLIAALIHDCGKIKYPLALWERILIVFLQKASPFWRETLLKRIPFLQNTWEIAEMHPQWGAELASQYEINPLVVDLIRQHHSPISPEGIILYEADNRN